jgi:toxin HigB-1
MKIESVRHKALRHFLETGNSKGLDARIADRLRNMVAFLVAARDENNALIDLDLEDYH